MAHYLVTGIAGFIGSSLARALRAQGHSVRGVDNFSTGSLENLDGILPEIDLRDDDVRDLDAMRRACQGIDFVLHQAAMASVPRSILDPLETHACNANGTLNVLIAARDAEVKRVVYAASSSAYGDQPQPLKDESMRPHPQSPYAIQKLTGEHYMETFFTIYGLETVCLRYFNIFGPRQSADSPYSGVIARFISMMLDGEAPCIYGQGDQSRDFTYVDNAVAANLLACTAPRSEVAGKVFNIGTGKSQTLLDLYASLAQLLHFTQLPSFQASRAGDVQHSQADITRATAHLGYRPTVQFLAGLEKTLQWYQASRNHFPSNRVTLGSIQSLQTETTGVASR